MMTRKTSEEVLEACGITTRPVPLDRILQHYGIQQVQLSASSDIFGAIVRQQGKVIIAVNPEQHLHRQRFTIAHELGHYFCHPTEEMQHVDTDFRIHWRNSASSQGVDWYEIEANRFAAALLMPEKMLRSDLSKYGLIDRVTTAHLASEYKVSRLAMQFRLINLGLLPPDVDPSGE